MKKVPGKGSQVPGKGSQEDIIRIFGEMAKIWEILGEEFKVWAYIKAINAIKSSSMAGIGRKLALKIKEILETGTLQEYEELKKLPEVASIELLNRIKGFGPKFIRKNKLISVEDIQKKVNSGQLKLNHQQQVGLKYYKYLIQPMLRAEMGKTFTELKKFVPKDARIVIAGSYRRGKQSSKDIDLLLIKKKVDYHSLHDFIEDLRAKGIVADHFILGHDRFSGVIKTKVNPIYRQLDILYVPEEDYYPALMHSTGSGNFNRRIRLIAKKKGMKLSDKGLFKGKVKLKINSEKDIFDILGLKYLKPKERVY